MTSTQMGAESVRAEWINALRDLSFRCAAEDADRSSARLREMNHLLAIAPAKAGAHGLQALGPARLDALLRADAADAAAMALFGCGAGYLLSRGGDGHCLATVVFPDVPHEESGSGATPALALIGAAAMLLADASSTAPRLSRMETLDACAVFH